MSCRSFVRFAAAHRTLCRVFFVAALACSSALHTSPARAVDYDIIIEKNLFHDQRRKWEMEKPSSKGASSQAGSAERQDIEQVKLFGTVIKDERSYAVMRVAAPPKPQRRVPRGRSRRAAISSPETTDTKRPYAVGDFIGGYRVLEIKPASVLIEDPSDNNRYEIFMNDGQTERSVERTEIPEDPPEERPGKGRPPSSRGDKPGPAPKPAQAADFMRKRLERDMELMRKDKSDAMARQAERDWERLEPMLPSLDEKRREELLRLKEEFEKLRKK